MQCRRINVSEWNAAAVADFLKAVAQETRLKIVRLLFIHSTDALPAGVIAAELDVPPNLLSFHLKELASSGVILKTVSGRNIFYSITPKTRRFVRTFREEFGVMRFRDDEAGVSEFGEII